MDEVSGALPGKACPPAPAKGTGSRPSDPGSAAVAHASRASAPRALVGLVDEEGQALVRGGLRGTRHDGRLGAGPDGPLQVRQLADHSRWVACRVGRKKGGGTLGLTGAGKQRMWGTRPGPWPDMLWSLHKPVLHSPCLPGWAAPAAVRLEGTSSTQPLHSTQRCPRSFDQPKTPPPIISDVPARPPPTPSDSEPTAVPHGTPRPAHPGEGGAGEGTRSSRRAWPGCPPQRSAAGGQSSPRQSTCGCGAECVCRRGEWFALAGGLPGSGPSAPRCARSFTAPLPP